MFSLSIYLELIDFNIDYLYFHIPEVVIPTIITSTVLFIWEYYRLYSKVKKYYNIGKVIFMFCKKKISFFYEKVYSFYKKF